MGLQEHLLESTSIVEIEKKLAACDFISVTKTEKWPADDPHFLGEFRIEFEGSLFEFVILRPEPNSTRSVCWMFFGETPRFHLLDPRGWLHARKQHEKRNRLLELLDRSIGLKINEIRQSLNSET